MGARLTSKQLREAAEVANATGTTITIEINGQVYKITPGKPADPVNPADYVSW